MQSIGKSFQGRDIHMLEVTNKKTGPGKDKPGVYTDGNTHAGEVTGCEVILYSIDSMLRDYGKDALVTELVDTRVFYFIPRITVDGSEHYLTTPYMLRSSMRPWPEDADDRPGLYAEDIDGNGKILTMRVENPDGAWKISPEDDRLMVRRQPHDLGGPGQTFYDVITEGLIKEYDPDLPINQAPSKYGLDFNRQYPANWTPPVRQPGSGDYPFSEPEMKAVGDFYLSHPNISTSMAYHTSGGILLRPFADKGDSQFDLKDFAIYKAVSDVGEDITGYPCKSVFDEFAWDPKRPPVGSDLEWAYESLGILSLETELWDMASHAGLPKMSYKAIRNLSEKEQEQRSLRLLQWNDEKMGGALFHNWKPFEHPQLGNVEIGGWEPKFGRQNPPVSLLEEECQKSAKFNLARASVTPRLVLDKVDVHYLGGQMYKVTAVVKNQGYLPTHGTFRALAMGQAKPVKIGLAKMDEGIVLVSGQMEKDLGHLGGRAGGGVAKAKADWVVKGDKGKSVTIFAETPRAGRVSSTVMLG